MSVEKSTLTVSLNNQNYDINVVLISGTNPPRRLPRGVVQEIVIEDNIYSIFHTATLTIDSSHNALDNFDVTLPGQPQPEDSSYTFNIDSRDMIIVEIKPVHKAKDNQRFPASVWGLDFAFFIHDEAEIILDNSNKKSKTFYLRDIREQYLRETNTRWSTADMALRGDVLNSQLSDIHRSAYTGDAIGDLIYTGLNDKGPDLTFATDWDHGAHKIFYTSTGDSTLFDDIEYILDDHSSADGDNCFLRAERSPDGSLFSLRSVSDYFAGANSADGRGLGPANADVFSIHGGTSTDDSREGHTKIPPKQSSSGIDSSALEMFDSLTSLELLNTSNADSMNELVTTIGHIYDYNTKQFIIKCKDTHVQAIRDKFEDLVQSKLISHKLSAIFPINRQKLENKVFKNIDTGIRSWHKKTVGRVLNKALAFSPGISFSVPGSTHRQAGRFYTLADKNAGTKTPFEKLIMGDWLGIKVTHIFMLQQNSYANYISCVRPYTYEPLLLDAPGTPGGMRVEGGESQVA